MTFRMLASDIDRKSTRVVGDKKRQKQILPDKKHDDEKRVKTSGGVERSVIDEEQDTESEEEKCGESGLPVLYTSEMSTPEHEQSYSPISTPGSSDFDVARGDLDDISLSGLSTVSEYLNTSDEVNSTSSLGSNLSELKRERPKVDGEKLADYSRDDYSCSDRGSLVERGKEKRSDAHSRHSDKFKKSTGYISSPGHSRDEHRSVHSDDSRPRRSKKRRTSRESTRPKKESSDDRPRSSSRRRDENSRSKSTKSRSRNKPEKSDHRSPKHSLRHSRDHNRSSPQTSRDRSRDRSVDRSPKKESRSRRKRRSRSSSTRRTSSRKARSRSNGTVSSDSSNERVDRKKRKRSRPTRKSKIDLSDEVLLEITKPEVMERIQELLRDKLRRTLEETPDCLEDPVNISEVDATGSRPFFGGISELIYPQRPEPETIVLQDPNCRSVLVERVRKRPAVEVDGEDVKLPGELKSISPNCGSDSGTFVGDCDGWDCTSRESLRIDSNLTKTIDDVHQIVREKYLPERNENERPYQAYKINDALNGDCIPEANDDVEESAVVGDECSYLQPHNECSGAETINESYIIELKAKRKRLLLLKQLRNMRAREKVRSTEVTLARLKNLNCDVCKTVIFSGKSEAPARGTLSVNREVDNELTLRCVDSRRRSGNAGSQSDVNAVSMEISDGDSFVVCEGQIKDHGKEMKNDKISVKASSGPKEKLKENNRHVDSVRGGAEYPPVDCVSAKPRKATSGTSADINSGSDAPVEEWVSKGLRDIRMASKNHAIKETSKTNERSDRGRRSVQTHRDESMNLNESTKQSRKRAQTAILDGKAEDEEPLKKVCKFDNRRRKHGIKKRMERVLIGKRGGFLKGNGPYFDDQIDISAESLGQVSACRTEQRHASTSQKRKGRLQKKANNDSRKKRPVKDHRKGRPTIESRSDGIRPDRCVKGCLNKQDEPARGTFFSRNISGPSEFDDIVAEARRHFQVQIQIVTHKIWCKNFPVESGNPFLSLTAQDLPPFTGSNSGLEIAKPLADIDEKPGNTRHDERSLVADQSKRNLQDTQSRCCLHERSEVTPTITPKTKQSPSCHQASNGRGEIENVPPSGTLETTQSPSCHQALNGRSEREGALDDDSFKTHLSSVLNSLTKPQLDILFRSPRQSNVLPVSLPGEKLLSPSP